MVPNPPVPDRTSITASWLASALDAPGHLESLTTELIGAGQMGTAVRYRLEWKTPTTEELPTAVVGKFPSDDSRSLAAAAATQAYHREIGFYQSLSAELGVAAPRCWYAELEPDTGRFVLLLDDLAPAVPGDQLHGCSPDQAHRAISAIATLHAPSWGLTQSPVPWLEMPSASWRHRRIALYRDLFAGFDAQFASLLNDEDRRIGRELEERLDDYYDAFVTPWALLHGDFRLDNILFDADQAWLVDWQTLSIGHGPADVGYFIATGFDTELRHRHVEDLIATYRHALEDNGLELDAAANDAIAADVHLGAASGYLMAVIASQIVEQTDRGDAMFAAMARRSAAYIRDSEWWNEGPLR